MLLLCRTQPVAKHIVPLALALTGKYFIYNIHENCNILHIESLNYSIDICAAGEGFKGVCHGDSGGPMFLPENGRHELLLVNFT